MKEIKERLENASMHVHVYVHVHVHVHVSFIKKEHRSKHNSKEGRRVRTE